MLVQADAGWQVWVTMPREMLRQNPTTGYDDRNYQQARRESFKGRRVAVTATLKRALADATQGTGLRPDGRLLDLAGLAAAA